MRIPAWMIFLGASAFICVAAGLGLVYVSNQNVHGLVRADYYEAGLHLDEQRLREAGFDSLHIRVALIEKTDSLMLEVQKGVSPDTVLMRRLQAYNVKLFLQRPDDPSADRELSLTDWIASTPSLRKGRWNCRVVFETGGVSKLEHSFVYNAEGG